MDPVERALSDLFGHGAFRPGQRQVIDAVLEGRHTVAVMPTGTGKSLCYQLPAVLLDGVTLVVSPLIALMKDQVDALTARGLPAAFLNSTQDFGEQRAVLDAARRGDLKLLYVAPERFRFGGAMAAIRSLPLAGFVVDEAHCISQWGHDFRPDYMALGQVTQELGVQRIAAFTATATGRVRDDIVRTLGLRDPYVEVTGFLRENLHLSVVHVRRMREKKSHIVKTLRGCGGAAIVYCATRKNCEEVASHLRGKQFDAIAYHGGLPDEARSAAQEAFLASEDMVIVATNAFGMGVDKANVRVVVHYDVPGSLEAYYQEAGRAGRDGEPARCVLLFTYADTRYQEFFIDNGGQDLPPDRRVAWAEHERQRLKRMVSYAYDAHCRHGAILAYFGEHRTIGPEGCGACDVCTGETGVPGISLHPGRSASESSYSRSRGSSAPAAPAEKRAMTDHEEVAAQKVLSAVARSQGRLGTRLLSKLLTGSRHKDVLADPLAATKSYGILGDHGERAVASFLRALKRAGCTQGSRPVLTNLGVEVMWKRKKVLVDIPELKPSGSSGTATSAVDELPRLDADERELLDRLIEVRLSESRERNRPAYTIATNKLLTRLAAARPGDSLDDWLAIKGVGPKNAELLREVFGPVLAG